MTEQGIDWGVLRAAALAATEHSYAPYSGLAVGCAALVTDGRVISGCNVENAAYGVTLCAECTMIGALHMGGGGKLVAFVCVDGAGSPLTPCGRCRQLLYEAAAPGMLLATGAGQRTIDELLPEAFGPSALPAAPPAQAAPPGSPAPPAQAATSGAPGPAA